MPSSTLSFDIDRVQCLVESRRVSIVKCRCKQLKGSSPLASVAGLELTVLDSLILNCFLNIVDLVGALRPAVSDCTAIWETKARFPVAIADRVVDVGVANLTIESAPLIFAIPFHQINVGPLARTRGSAFSWGSRDEQGEGCQSEKGDNLHLELVRKLVCGTECISTLVLESRLIEVTR